MLSAELTTQLIQLSRDDIKEVYDVLKHRSHALAQQEKSAFSIGDEVYWISKKKGSRIDGKVTKVMKKNVKVLVGYSEWTVHPSFLHHNEDSYGTISDEDMTKLNGAIEQAAHKIVNQNTPAFNPLTGDFE